MKASARKSYGEYKPLIVHPSGRTEVVGQRGHLERIQPQTKFYDGPLEVWHAHRGVTFKSREEAVRYAQQHIDRLIENRARKLAEYEARQKRYAEQKAE